jgi:hypothetical protein
MSHYGCSLSPAWNVTFSQNSAKLNSFSAMALAVNGLAIRHTQSKAMKVQSLELQPEI